MCSCWLAFYEWFQIVVTFLLKKMSWGWIINSKFWGNYPFNMCKVSLHWHLSHSDLLSFWWALVSQSNQMDKIKSQIMFFFFFIWKAISLRNVSQIIVKSVTTLQLKLLLSNMYCEKRYTRKSCASPDHIQYKDFLKCLNVSLFRVQRPLLSPSLRHQLQWVPNQPSTRRSLFRTMRGCWQPCRWRGGRRKRSRF